MSSGHSARDGQLHTAEIFRDRWRWLVLPGSVPIAGGILQIMQSAKMLHWIGFIRHLLLGILAAIGGVLIYLDPFAGVIAISLLIAIILAVHRVTRPLICKTMR